MDKKDKKKGSGGVAALIWVLIVAVGFLVNSQSFHSFGFTVRRMMRTMPEILPLLAGLLVFLFILIFVIKAASSRKKEHTHDRTDTVSFDGNETEFEHYKKQLDGFLHAGIIEKEEYRLLLRRYQERGY